MGLDIFFRKTNKNEERPTELAYFRKVNFLVRFMENYGNIENCVDFPLTKEIVQDLYDKCKEVIMAHLECFKDKNKEDAEAQIKFEKKAHELLPTCDGFFFGSTYYDDWYYEDIKDVKKKMKKVLNEFDNLKENEEIVFHIWY